MNKCAWSIPTCWELANGTRGIGNSIGSMNFKVPDLARTIDLKGASAEELHEVLDKQWLVTNGVGGYASGTISGAVTWKYHGLLVAALKAPFGRTTMFNHLTECLRTADGKVIQFGGGEPAHAGDSEARNFCTTFYLRNHIPFWRYEMDGIVLEKRILMPYLQNTVHITYTLASEQEGIRLELRPSFDFRPFEASVAKHRRAEYEVRSKGEVFEIHSPEGFPPLRVCIRGARAHFTNDGGSTRSIFYEKDAERGYEAEGTLWSPGYFSVDLKPKRSVTLAGSTEDWHTISAIEPALAYELEQERRRHLLRIAHSNAQQSPAAELVLAADQFIITPTTRIEASARAHAAGDELRSVIAGYHWFTDWGRDTMISLEGLTLLTGRYREAEWILKTFANAAKDGLIPNMFPEGKNDGLYHTADATLWMFQSLHRYLELTGDRETLRGLLPTLRDIVEHHLRGTRFGIGMDPGDGLLRQGEKHYQLTWMDAKVDDWVVTPRRGKAVEINALWFNTLCLLARWLEDEGESGSAKGLRKQAERVRGSFNHRFWNSEKNCLFDVVDGEEGDDSAIRPNQIFAISLTHAVLDEKLWKPVFETVRRELLTPAGLRSLSRDHPSYKARYFGDLRSRDAAYHQGTVWGWLIGPFVEAWLKVHPKEIATARKCLEGLLIHLNEGCIGSISEVFDAEPPYTQRGCVAQAWSVAEVLRALVLTAER